MKEFIFNSEIVKDVLRQHLPTYLSQAALEEFDIDKLRFDVVDSKGKLLLENSKVHVAVPKRRKKSE